MGDRHLEAAAEAAFYAFDSDPDLEWFELDSERRTFWIAHTATVLGAHYDSLLGDLPEEAVEAMRREHYGHAPSMSKLEATCRRLNMEEAAHAFLRSLRDSLASRTGGTA